MGKEEEELRTYRMWICDIKRSIRQIDFLFYSNIIN